MNSSDAKLKWWNRPLWRGRPSRYSPEVGKAVQWNFCIQLWLFLFLPVLIASPKEEFLLAVGVVAVVGWWIGIAPALVRRPKTPTEGELMFIRAGFIAMFSISLLTMPFWGWVRKLFT